MLFPVIVVLLGVPALLVGYRGYMVDKRAAWGRRGLIGLWMAAIIGYVAWGALDRLLKDSFGVASGLGFDGMAAIIYCSSAASGVGFRAFCRILGRRDSSQHPGEALEPAQGLVAA